MRSDSRFGAISWIVLCCVLSLAVGCKSDDEGDDESSEGDGSSTGDDAGGVAGSGADEDSEGGGSGSTGSGSGNAGSDADEPRAGSGSGSGEGGSGGDDGEAGSSGEVSEELAAICDELDAFNADLAEQTGCAPEDDDPRKLCEGAAACVPELRDALDCVMAAPVSAWSCETPEDTAAIDDRCDATDMAFFACLRAQAPATEGKYGCEELAAVHNGLADELGCERDPNYVENCNALHMAGTCVPAWESIIDCLGGLDAPASSFMCDEDNAFKPKEGLCAEERDAFSACISM